MDTVVITLFNLSHLVLNVNPFFVINRSKVLACTLINIVMHVCHLFCQIDSYEDVTGNLSHHVLNVSHLFCKR